MNCTFRYPYPAKALKIARRAMVPRVPSAAITATCSGLFKSSRIGARTG